LGCPEDLGFYPCLCVPPLRTPAPAGRYCTVKLAPFASRGKDAAASDTTARLDGEEKQMALVLRTALLSTVMLSKYPKAIVEVHVCVLQGDGGAWW
jgi:ribonuclease PH